MATLDYSVRVPVYPEKGRSLFALCITAITITTLSIILRFWSRATLRGKKFGADDWLALAAWPFVIGELCVTLLGTRTGLGLHVTQIPYGNIMRILQYLYAAFMLYNSGIGLVRLSALFFYRRVFQYSSQLLPRIIIGTIILNICWIIGFDLLAILNCIPVQAYWDRTITDYKCVNTQAQQWASGMTSIFIDFWILCLPLPTLLKLKMPLQKKLMTILVFVAGYIVVVFTCGRLASTVITGSVLDTDVSWGFVTTSYWYVCEETVALTGVSLPTIFHLFNRGYRHGWRSMFNDKDYLIQSQVYTEAQGKSSHRSNSTTSTMIPNNTAQHLLRPDFAGGSVDARITGHPGYEFDLSDLEDHHIRKVTDISVDYSHHV